MSLEALDPPAVARALALIANRSGDHAELYLERRTEIVLAAGEGGRRVRRESGLSARLLRGERSWLASRDELSGRAVVEALRSVARVLPPALPEPVLPASGGDVAWPPAPEVEAFPGRLERALRRRLVGFPYRLTVRWHERDLRVVQQRTATGIESERFASLETATEWGRCGLLTTGLDDADAEALAGRLTALFHAREAPPPPRSHPPLLLAPSATAVALHECVAHALEADLLSASGHPAAADGVELGSGELDVLDHPGGAPPGVARAFDDEGSPTCRRWLLRRGRVAQPIADLRAARRWPEFLPGSGFRADRHAPPLPRSHHLELLAGATGEAELWALAGGGIWIEEIASGTLDPSSGRFTLLVPAARRIRDGAAAESVGPFRLRGRIASLLSGVVAVGARRQSAGAGWCAKAGQRRPVWATVPALVLAGLEVLP